MGTCVGREKNRQRGIPTIKCTYEINENELVQILNNKGKKCINEEFESKIKIMNGDIKEPLVFTKKFNNLGDNTVYFIIEEKLTDMSYLFNKCSSLKKKKLNFFLLMLLK